MILVTGATGNVGSETVRLLQERELPVRAFVRDPAKAAELFGEQVELAEGDFEDAGLIRRAMEGADALFLLTATDVNQAEREIRIIDAAVDAGVGRIVKISSVGSEVGSECAFLDRHGRAEEHLQRSGIPWTIVRGSGFYMTNLLFYAVPVREADTLPVDAGEARIAMIDPHDVAAAAIVPLTTDGHDGQIYELSGPAAITFEDIAADLSRVTGRTVAYVTLTDEQALQGMLEAGVPEVLAQPLTVLYRLLRDGMNDTPTDTVRELSGRDPRPFLEFAKRYAAAFGG